MVTFNIPIFDVDVTVLWDKRYKEELPQFLIDQVEDGFASGMAMHYVKDDLKKFAIYLNIESIKVNNVDFERLIDHEVIHLVFFILEFIGVEVTEGGKNETFAYLHNYIDEQIWKVLTESNLIELSE